MALWRGWLPSVIGVIPYVGLNFATYETSKEIVMRHYGAAPAPSCVSPGGARSGRRGGGGAATLTAADVVVFRRCL